MISTIDGLRYVNIPIAYSGPEIRIQNDSQLLYTNGYPGLVKYLMTELSNGLYSLPTIHKIQINEDGIEFIWNKEKLYETCNNYTSGIIAAYLKDKLDKLELGVENKFDICLKEGYIRLKIIFDITDEDKDALIGFLRIKGLTTTKIELENWFTQTIMLKPKYSFSSCTSLKYVSFKDIM
jgi:hypothetical protein